MITFITKYDDKASKFGGMVRVKDIEALFKDKECCFLEIDFVNPLKFKSFVNSFGNTHHIIGVFRFACILKVINSSDYLYFHTVGNFIKSYLYTRFSKATKVIDLHGAQPEEFAYSGNGFKSTVWGYFEKKAIKECKYLIHVSNNMKKHFSSKYSSKKKEFVIPIFSACLENDRATSDNLEELKLQARLKLGIPSDSNIILYSGGAQAWQKVDFIRDYIIKNKSGEATFYILSNQIKEFKSLLGELLVDDDIRLLSVDPSELASYYLAADYGMIFRDDTVLNHVSSPTKLSEYLFYGMTPIFYSTKVGDFVDEGIEYIMYDEPSFVRNKSWKNRKIIIDKMESSDKKSLLGYMS